MERSLASNLDFDTSFGDGARHCNSLLLDFIYLHNKIIFINVADYPK